MRVSRFFWFLFSILLGAAAGLGVGWYLRPASLGDAALAELRADYRCDYVLMVAEVFDVEKDVALAVERLKVFGDEPPARLVQIAVVQAGELAYDRRDLELLAKLSQAVAVLPDAPGATPSPRGRP
jgi:hypothetical protein